MNVCNPVAPSLLVIHDAWMTRKTKTARVAENGDASSLSADTYTHLLDSVVWAVHEYGYAGATMERIATRAGFTRGALQHYFGNRRVDVIVRVTSELLTERQALYEARYGNDPIRAETDVRAEMKLAFRDPRTWFLIEVWIASKSDSDLRKAIDKLQDHIERLSDTALELTLNQFSRIPFPVLKAFLRSLTRGIALEQSRHSNERIYDDVVDLAFDALAALEEKMPHT